MVTFKDSAVIFDMDGVLANNSAELAAWIDLQEANGTLGRTPDEWQGWYDLLAAHPPAMEYVALLNMMKDAGHKIIVMTARPERIRETTYLWLDTHCPAVDRLMMWNETDDIFECKANMLHGLLMEFNVMLAIDDNKHWCDTFRSLGVPALYVHDGHRTMI